MGIEKLELLEARLMKVVKVVSELREKNAALEKQVGELQSAFTEKSDELTRYQEEKRQVSALQVEAHTLLEEREQIRNKIESMLDSLESVDIV